jgi:hypothetical protein
VISRAVEKAVIVMKRIIILLAGVLLLAACSANNTSLLETDHSYLINENGQTVQERITAPDGYERTEVSGNSFGHYLRNLPLKPHGSKVKHHDGRTKLRNVHVAVVDMDVGERDLQQCADAVIRLRAEYLYGIGQYDKIHFNFTNGFRADYSTWMEGKRIQVQGNDVTWVNQTGYADDYASFRKYLDMVFAYAGTLSLSKELKKVPLEEIKIGDVFIEGGSPGHCVIVVDMAENKDTGEKLFLLAQSYMPAQDIHILKNPKKGNGNPWYSTDFGETLITPEWKFDREDLKRFED